MKKKGHVPVRTCGGCGRKGAASGLTRLVMSAEGSVLEDAERKLPGRGVYCCRNEQCRSRLEGSRRRLKRAFRLLS